MEQISVFGTTKDGQEIKKIHLENNLLTAEIITLGAALQSLKVPDRGNCPTDIVLGFDTVKGYEEQDCYIGAVIGRYANRIAGGSYTLNGKTYSGAINNGPNHLHGGLRGFNLYVWDIIETTPESAVLEILSPDGDEGYPGNLKVRVTYQLKGASLEIHYQAECDQDTICNLTNHSYFNLEGQGSGCMEKQEICLEADAFTPSDETSIPTGEIRSVEGTPMDLRKLQPIGGHIGDDYIQLKQAAGYDHNWVIRGAAGTLRPAAEAYAPGTGIRMKVQTTLPGLQFYTANFLGNFTGKGGVRYDKRHAFCLETQQYPDAPNKPGFPSPLLRAGEKLDEKTVFSFEN